MEPLQTNMPHQYAIAFSPNPANGGKGDGVAIHEVEYYRSDSDER